MPHTLPPFSHHPHTVTPLLPADSAPPFTSSERAELEKLLAHKLRGIPPTHIPTITLEDILLRTEKTKLPNLPADIGLAFLLRKRGEIDAASAAIRDGLRWGHEEKKGNKGDGSKDANVDTLRAIWFYRLDPVRRFQRQHDGVRWNIAIFTALLTQHTLMREGQCEDARSAASTSSLGEFSPGEFSHPKQKLNLPPSAIRFTTSYLAAVLEHHSSPSSFERRESFVRLWRTSRLDLFTIHRSWAKKALQRALRQLSFEWEGELSRAREQMGSAEYEAMVAPLVGSLVPARVTPSPSCLGSEVRSRGSNVVGREMEMGSEEGAGNELLDALRAPCAGLLRGEGVQRAVGDEQAVMVCDLRTAISCVQSMRPSDMLLVLMRLFSHAG